ncbi:hypothetical protein BJ912DRAFT_954157 [Pholiota molesta]|nr:hypothetical protein BJ912DRAFT_954157 [Pholiota molesta]
MDSAMITPRPHDRSSVAFPPMPPKLLAALRHNFQKIEQLLYTQLAKTSEGSLNDHLSAAKAKLVGELVADEPPWWDKRCHAVPGGNIIVREDDWGSIIAHTLSTTDYLLELSNLSMVRSGSASQPNPIHRQLLNPEHRYKFFSSSSKNQPDPDQEKSYGTSPKHILLPFEERKHKDSTSLLAIRDVLRRKALSSSNIAMPSAVKSKPDIGLTMQAAGGKALLQGLGQATTSRPASTRSGITPSASPEPIPTDVKEENGGSGASSDSGDSQNTIGKNHGVQLEISFHEPSQLPPPLPPKDDPKTPSPEHISLPSTSTTAPPHGSPHPGTKRAIPVVGLRQHSGERPELGDAVRHEKRAGFAGADARGTANTSTKSQHHRPHIKYDWTIGKRLKFSCTVYYAKQFDMLRKRCGIHDVFMKSLAKSTNWMAEGGKSKSNFWKTSDDRFIIKTLQVLVDFAPSKPTVLCKNLETGATQSKADLLVMENLFFNQNINKTFDLKGIQGRKVKSHGDTTKTFFDGEWIEGQQRTLTLVRPHSKVILRDAIKNDAEFLARSNIMDYSLLLGVDEQKKEIACGLVDTIGSYTFAKTLEYKAKQGLQSGKEVTVMPPTEYQERFVSALEGYFVACPDKWSKPLDESKIINDPDLLPSVL